MEAGNDLMLPRVHFNDLVSVMILMVKNYLTACTKNNIIFAAKSEMASLGQIIVP